jgi:threonine/homoserine/homoserine lactone efflux protein
MKLAGFILQIIIISLTGVMLPGPMTAIAIGKGSKMPHSGLLMALGHGIIEIPLIFLIFFGFGYLFQYLIIKILISIIGGIFLTFTAINMLKSIKNIDSEKTETGNASPIISGIILSAGNPPFLLWWITIGNILIFKAYNFGLVTLILFIILHLSCDAVWLDILSFLSYKGGKFFGNIFQKIIFAVCGVLLLFFGGKFIYDAIRMII